MHRKYDNEDEEDNNNYSYTCKSRWTAADKSVYLILTRSIVFTRITKTFIDVRLAASTCKGNR